MVVTDSTAAVPADVALAAGLVVVPLDVLVDGVRHDAASLTPAALVAALSAGARVSTSQPPPAAFAAAYAAAAAAGATEVVSVHLSGALSGTVDGARLAAAHAAVPVRVVDARTAAMGLGFAALAAAREAQAGVGDEVVGLRARWARWRGRELTASAGAGPRGGVGGTANVAAAPPTAPSSTPVERVVARAEQVAATARVWFLVDSLEHLRRGGRLGAAAAALGTVLGLRPILTVRDGEIVVAERVRTRRAARERLLALASADAAARPGHVRAAVHHLGQAELAGTLADELVGRLPGRLVERVVGESDAVIAAHVGPGLLAIVVVDA